MFDNDLRIQHIKYISPPEGGGEQINAPHYLHEYSWEEIQSTKDTVVDEQGHIWTGKDRRSVSQKALWVAWLASFKTRKPVPEGAMASFQKQKFHLNPPAEAKPFVWSYSALSQFDTCPRQFAAQRVHKTMQSQETEATRWGTRVHKAFENVGQGVGSVEDYDLLRDQGWVKYIDAIIGAEGAKTFEHQYGITRSWKPTGFFAADCWGRGVADVLCVKGSKATILDYKTGKVKDDPFQLRVFCMFTALEYPEVQEFDAKFIWLKHDEITGLSMTRPELVSVMKEVKGKVERIEQAVEHDVFAMRPSGLCRGWCGVTECPHCRG